jgi:acetyl esterase/lipase
MERLLRPVPLSGLLASGRGAACALLLAGCGQLERAAARQQVEVEEGLVYRAGSSDPKHQLDLYLPRGKRGFPVVVFVHGGYWRGGDRSYYRPLTGLYGNVGLALAQRGIAAAVISYRISPQVAIEGMLDDVAAAVRSTHDRVAQAGGAADQLFLAGHSAGGHLAALLSCDGGPLLRAGADPAWVRGVIALSPVLDLFHLRANQDASFNAEVTSRVFGGDDRLARFSPAQRCDGAEPPWLVLYGGDDFPYLREQLPAVAEALRRKGARVELQQLAGLSHQRMVLQFDASSDLATPLCAAFVQRQLARAP